MSSALEFVHIESRLSPVNVFSWTNSLSNIPMPTNYTDLYLDYTFFLISGCL